MQHEIKKNERHLQSNKGDAHPRIGWLAVSTITFFEYAVAEPVFADDLFDFISDGGDLMVSGVLDVEVAGNRVEMEPGADAFMGALEVKYNDQ